MVKDNQPSSSAPDEPENSKSFLDKRFKPESFYVDNIAVERTPIGFWLYKTRPMHPMMPLNEAPVNIIDSMIRNLTNCPIKPKGVLLELLGVLEQIKKMQEMTGFKTHIQPRLNHIKKEDPRGPNKVYKKMLFGSAIYYINQYAFELTDDGSWIVTDDDYQRQPISVLSLSVLTFLRGCFRKYISDECNYNSDLHKAIEDATMAASKLECVISGYTFKNTSPGIWTMSGGKGIKDLPVTEAKKDFLWRLCRVLDDTSTTHPDYNKNLHDFIKSICTSF